MHTELSSYRQKGLDYTKKSMLVNMLGLYDHFEEGTRGSKAPFARNSIGFARCSWKP